MQLLPTLSLPLEDHLLDQEVDCYDHLPKEELFRQNPFSVELSLSSVWISEHTIYLLYLVEVCMKHTFEHGHNVF